MGNSPPSEKWQVYAFGCQLRCGDCRTLSYVRGVYLDTEFGRTEQIGSENFLVRLEKVVVLNDVGRAYQFRRPLCLLEGVVFKPVKVLLGDFVEELFGYLRVTPAMERTQPILAYKCEHLTLPLIHEMNRGVEKRAKFSLVRAEQTLNALSADFAAVEHRGQCGCRPRYVRHTPVIRDGYALKLVAAECDKRVCGGVFRELNLVNIDPFPEGVVLHHGQVGQKVVDRLKFVFIF